MSFKYPFQLYKVVPSEPNFIGQIVDVEVYVCECDEQVNTKAQMVRDDNGVTFVYASLIFLPIVTDFEVGDCVVVKDGDKVRLKGTVKRNSNTDNVGSRLWV